MKVSEVRIIPVKSGNGSTKAYASINLDGVFAVNDIRVVEGKKGLFISDRKSTRLNSSHNVISRMPSSA